MKRILLLACIVSSIQAGAQNYRILGTADGFDGVKVTLSNDKKQIIDSTVVTNGKFMLERPLEKVQVASLKVGGAGEAILLDENPIMAVCKLTRRTYKGKESEVPDLVISGDDDQHLLSRMNAALMLEMMPMMALAFMKDGTSQGMRDSIADMYVAAKKHTKELFDSITINCRDSYVGAIIMKDHLSKDLSYDTLKARFDAFSDRVKTSSIGHELAEKLASLNAVSLGRIAPDFTLPTPEDKELSLSSLRGSVVLVDFWASWCGPCLREVPNVKKVYAKYKDKGFEILSVSLDDKRDNWLNAIKKHELAWKHVSSLKGWQCPIAKQYNVTGIPAMFLLDRDGKIVSTNARGEKLEEEVSKLCK